LRLPWKTELSRNVSLYGIYFLHSEFLSNLHALALKNRVVLIFFTVFKHVFLSFRIFEQLAFALINKVAQKFFAVWNILLTFRIFEQLALALKNRRFPECTVLNTYFYYSGFLNNLRLPWKTEGSGIFHCIEYTLYIHEFRAICMRLPWKTELPWYFALYLNMYFIIQDFWATSACPEK